MFLETNIPEDYQRPSQAKDSFGDRMFDVLSVKHQTNPTQAVLLGNRCNHIPDAPRFFNRPENHKRRPPVLEHAIETLRHLYKRPNKFFRKLASFNPNDRKKRSERREAIVSVSQVLLHYLELSTMRVGFYGESNNFIALDLKYIAAKSKISISRVKRAIHDLVTAGYIKLTKQFIKNKDGSFKGSPSLREIAVKFFLDLGIDCHKLFFAREWKRKKQEIEEAKKFGRELKGLMKRSGPSTSNFKTNEERYRKTTETQGFIKKALELHKANPEFSPAYYYEKLQRLKE